MSFIEFYHLIRTERSDLLGQNSCRVFKWFNQSQIRAPPVTNTVINTFPGVYKKNPQRTRPSCEVQPDLWQHAKDSATDQSADHQQPEDQVCCRGGRHVQWIQTSSGEDLKKTALNRRQCKNRVAFAKVHSLWKGWTVEKWQKTLFFDESSIELHSHYHKYCRRPVGTCRDPRFIQKTVKFGGGKIMVGVTSSMWMCERSVKWMATSTAWSIKFLLPITPPERANSSAGWRSFSYFSLHIKIPESEGQGAPGLASPVTRHKHYWACLG